ncbi:MAG: MC/SLC25 family protein [archaeon]|nr:MC/SLC25 family protein [archaeon]
MNSDDRWAIEGAPTGDSPVRPTARGLAHSLSRSFNGQDPEVQPSSSSSDPSLSEADRLGSSIDPRRASLKELAHEVYTSVLHTAFDAPWLAVYLSAAASPGGRACPNGFEGNFSSLARMARADGPFGIWRGALALGSAELLEILVVHLLRRYYPRNEESPNTPARTQLVRARRNQAVLFVLRLLVIVLKHVLQVISFRMMYSRAPHASSMRAVVSHILSTRGAMGLLRGLPLTLIQAFVHIPLPLEAIRVRQMVADGPSRSTIADITHIWRSEGLWGFYTGWKAWILSLLPHTIVYLIFEAIRDSLLALQSRTKPAIR